MTNKLITTLRAWATSLMDGYASFVNPIYINFEIIKNAQICKIWYGLLHTKFAGSNTECTTPFQVLFQA